MIKKMIHNADAISSDIDFLRNVGTVSPPENILHNPQEAPSGKYFEYDIENVEFCCDKMRSKQGTTDTFIKEDRVEGGGISRRWYCKCPYCQTPLVFTISGFCIDKDSKKAFISLKHSLIIKKMITIREEKELVLRNPNNAPTGNYFEYDIKEIEFCCDEMREKEGTKDLHLIGDRVEGEGLNRLWHCRCPYCKAPLVLSRTHLRIENP